MRYFEYTDGNSKKFWEIHNYWNEHPSSIVVKFGKIGKEGRTTEHKYNTLEEGKKLMNNLIEQKIKKGYVEKPKPKNMSTSNKEHEKKTCPEGKELNPATGRCVKIKIQTKKLKKKVKEPKGVIKPPYNDLFLARLNELEKIMMMKGDFMRARAYQKAQQAIMLYSDPITNVDQIKDLKGIGKTIIEKFEEYIKTGKIDAIEKEKNNPLIAFTNVYGIGPKKAKDLISSGITSIEELRKHEDKLSSSQKLGLQYYDDINARIPRSEIKKYDTKMKTVFDNLNIPNSSMNIVGSYRRGAKNSGDIDIIITNKNNNKEVFSKFIEKLLEDKILLHKLTDGKTKVLGIAKLNDKSTARRVDFLYTPPDEYAFATLYFTGSKIFNTVMRQRALDRGYTLNEHGIYKMVNGKKGAKVSQEFSDEKDIFDFLDMKYKEPQERIDARSVVDKSSGNNTVKNTKEVNTKKECPEGKELNPATGRCVKIKTKKLVKKKKNIEPVEEGEKSSGKALWDVEKQGVMLAHTYKDPKTGKVKNPPKGTPEPPVGWWLSEKYDGYRAIWDGQEFRSRTGNIFETPDWFKEWLPKDNALDGELFLGRDNFEACGVFRRKTADTEEWKKLDVTYQIFDSPTVKGDFEERQKQIKQIIDKMCKSKKGKCPLKLTKQTKVKSEEQVYNVFEELVKKGAEGVMLRAPNSPYEPKRTAYLLKVKQFFDDECKIVGYKEGTGKYKDMLGAFECQMVKDKNVTFSISGMDDEIRKNYKKTHPIGTIVTFTYISKTGKGQPRHPNYLRKRNTPE